MRDLTGGFKCFRREVLEAIDFDTVRSHGYAFQVELTYRAVQTGFRVVEVPIIFRDREHGQSKMSWRHRRRGDVARAAAALQLAAGAEPMRRGWMPPRTRSPTACAHRATLRALAARPWPVLGRWVAGSALAAGGLLAAVWLVASLDSGYEQIIDAAAAVRGRRRRRRAHRACAATCSCWRCTRWRASPGFIAGSSLPLQAEHQRGVSRWLHEHGGRIAIAFVVLRDDLLAVAPGLRDRPHASPASRTSCASRRGCCCSACSRTRSPSSSRCSCRSRRGSSPAAAGEWDQLLAATFVTVAIAVPVLVVAALIEVYVSPHLFTALTHIHPPIVTQLGRLDSSTVR